MTRAQWEQGRPRVTAENQQVLDAWLFCGCEWSPAQIPYAAAFLDITDLDFLVHQMQVLRDAINRWRAAQEQASHGKRTAI